MSTLWTFGLLWLALSAFGPVIDPGLENTRGEQAKKLYAEHKFAEAAAVYETLWRTTKEPKYLFNAAAAHEAATWDTHALVYFQRYQRIEGMSEAERARAQERIDRLLPRLMMVRVEVSPARALGPSAALRLVRGGTEVRHALRVPLAWLESPEPGIYNVPLELGPWQLELKPATTIEGYRQEMGHLRENVVVEPAARGGASPVRFSLTPAMVETVLRFGPRRALRKGVTVRLRDPLGVENDVEVSTSSAEVHLKLRPGRWVYQAALARPGAQSVTGEVMVGSGEPVELWFKRGRGSAEVSLEERRLRRKLGLGLGLTGLGLAGVGAGLLGGGMNAMDEKYEYVFTMGDGACAGDMNTRASPRAYNHCVGFTMASYGAGVLGGAAGLGSTALAATKGVGRKGWIIMGSLAILISGVGFAWAKAEIPEIENSSVENGMVKHDESLKAKIMIPSALAGWGAGMLVGTVAGVVANRRLWLNARLRAMGSFGVVVQGAF